MSETGNRLKIMGIDPGTATVGYGVLDYEPRDWFDYVNSGIIQTPPTLPVGKRLGMIREDLIQLIETFQPDVVVVESIFFFKNAKTLVPVAQARGVILEACSAARVATVEYTPVQVKLNLTGHGRADKKLVQVSIARLLGLSEIIRPDDASDALALAVCHARMMVPAPTGSSPSATHLMVAE